MGGRGGEDVVQQFSLLNQFAFMHARLYMLQLPAASSAGALFLFN